QHLLNLRPMPVQRHRIAPRGPAVAEADHASDIGETQRRVDHRSECEIIKAAMVARGVPAERILEEHRAQNTGENVIFSLPV
ncbi:YdcF family protein, partial [Bradyrhizobium sp. UFLA 03-164]|nr:YdcF family protein [Bradyrhizobium uaiense]